tara:strand:+ start:339 stop:1925 length:1587 start_codon:yes stop_codon:yes gene_type:complete
MKIQKILIKNFLSFADSELKFSKYSGLTLIKGANKDAGGSNGSGKSALLEALFFGLTGNTIRKSNEDSLVNNQAGRKCLVELHLDKDIVIRRQKKPTKLEFFVGKENLTQSTVHKTQELIYSTFNTSLKILKASMFFGQENNLNFLDCSSEDKRSIIKNFLNLDDVFDMRDRIKKHKSGFYQKMKQQDALTAEHKQTIQDLDKKVTDIQEAKEQFSDYDESILSLSLEDIIESEKQETNRSWQLATVSRDIDGVNHDILKYKTRLELGDTKGVCDKCGQSVEEKLNTAFLETEIAKLEKEHLILLNSKDNLEKEETSDIKISSKEFAKVLKYKDLCRDETNYVSLQDNFSSKIKDCEIVKNTNRVSYDVMRFWEVAFSEHGIIKYIIRNILDYLNERCNYYLSYLSANKYFVEFNEELIEKIETNGRIVQYISLSGGEKRKINLAVMLALKDLLLLTDKNQSDLLFFDEVSENLDEEGVSGLYELFKEIKKTKTLFVITHNKYLKTLLDSSKRISVVKKDGISKIIKG